MALDTDRLGALLEEASVVDNPGGDALSLLNLVDGVASSLQTNSTVVPGATPQEMQQLVVYVVDLVGIGARSCRNGLRALALPVAEDPASVDGERLASASVLQVLVDSAEVLLQPACRRNFRDLLGHSSPFS